MINLQLISEITFSMLLLGTTNVHAHVNSADSVVTHTKDNKLSLDGYGEAAYSRNFIVIMEIVTLHLAFTRKTQAMEDLIFHMLVSILDMILEKAGR